MPTSTQLLKIGEFARRADVSLRTLRYYEELGLIQPAARTRGRFRCYREADLDRIRWIQGLQQMGLRLEQIGVLLEMPVATVDRQGFFEKVRRALSEQQDLVDAEIHRLREESQRIAEARAKLSECQCCQHVPSPDNNHCEPCGVNGKSLPDCLRALY